MATTIQSLPVAYQSALDEVLAGATYASAFNVQGAEFVNAHQISVPDISFGSSPDPTEYDRFATEGDVTVGRTTYTLDHDVEKSFYIDAADATDEPAASITSVVAEYQRTVFAPYVDKDFFAVAAKQAKATKTETLTKDTVKAAVRAARTQFTNAGLSGGNIYMSSDAIGFLEDATSREWSNETALTDSVGVYDGLNVFEVPSDLLGATTNFLAISGGTNTIRYITKRATAFTFAPGQHTKGDGYLAQLRWIFGSIVYKNKKPGIYASVHAAA
jgi:hypothetical protein